MSNLIQLLARVSRDQILRMDPADRARLARECDRVAGLTRIERATGHNKAQATQRIVCVEPEDHPDY
jgi:hypothetical protein